MRPGRIRLLTGCVSAALALPVWLLPAGYGMTALCLLALGLYLIFSGLMVMWDTKTAKRLRLAVRVCVVIGFGLFLTAEIPILMDARSDEDTAADWVIVMGAGINGTEPSESLSERLTAAEAWLRSHPDARAVVSGSQAPDELLSEARVMYDWLVERGVDPARVFMEEQADNSCENLVFSRRIIEENGGAPHGVVALLSSEYHLHRLRYMAERLGMRPVCVAARTERLSLAVNYFIREAFALWKCRLFGF